MNSSGNATGVVLVFHDVTAKRLAQRALKQERDFVTAVLETAGALVVVLDRQGQYHTLQRAACEKLTGYTSAEVLGAVFYEFLIPAEEMPGVGARPGKNCRPDHSLTRMRTIGWPRTAHNG